MRTLPLSLAAVSTSLLLTTAARAEIVPVANADELLAALEAAAAGDEIVLADGTYAIPGAGCNAMGTEAAPIVVRAANPHGARIDLDSLEGFIVRGAHWRFEDLDIHGACANDSSCEHAFHVVGAAEGFVLRGNRIIDFSSQLKVNASLSDGSYVIPHRGLVEGNEIRDTSPRETDAPVTKLNIDTGDDWVVRANVIADFHKNGGNGISYGAFMKSGGNRGVFEQNLVLCSDAVQTGGVRIGLSFGGGGTGNQYCAPAFDADVPCDPEHTDGLMRNNIIVGCSDVGIYLNKSADTRLLHNTLVATTGIDFRYASSTGEADGNLVSGRIRGRDGGSFTAGTNVEEIALETFLAAYQDPEAGDLRLLGDVSAWIGAGTARADVPDDYCLRDRPDGPTTLGALEHSLGDCETVPPPLGGDSSSGSGGGQGGDDPAGSGGGAGTGGGPGGDGGAASGGNANGSGGATASGGPGATSGAGGSGDGAAAEDDGCGCRVVGAPETSGRTGHGAFAALVVAAAVAALRGGRPKRHRP
ncbi:chondroitinase-B domain-containing protein [Sorangium sp. So ce362]|uniref:chondroitinase-B domain-containing protein n=1 Tax=Sorangium sp. So ce362 TaxID=3133303 RepID=UPI003F645471